MCVCVCVCVLLVCSLHPDIYLCLKEHSAAYKRWYFEVEVTEYVVPKDAQACRMPHLRVGWANATYFNPHPSSNGMNMLSKLGGGRSELGGGQSELGGRQSLLET